MKEAGSRGTRHDWLLEELSTVAQSVTADALARVQACRRRQRSRRRSGASTSRAGKLASARTLPLPRRLVADFNVFCTRGYTVTGYSHATDRADRRRRDTSLRPTSGFASKRHAQKSAPDRARDRPVGPCGRRRLGGTASRAASRLSQTVRFTKNGAERGASRRSDRRSHRRRITRMPIVDRSDARITGTAATTRQGQSAAPFFRSDERLAERDAVPPQRARSATAGGRRLGARSKSRIESAQE